MTQERTPPLGWQGIETAREHLPECWGQTSYSEEKACCFCPPPTEQADEGCSSRKGILDV